MQLPADAFDPPEPAPEPPAGIVRIGELARAVNRKVDSIRNWIEEGVIPPAPIRLAHGVRAWPAAEAAELVSIAHQEHIVGEPGKSPSGPLGETNFKVRAWDARRRHPVADAGQQ